MSILAGIIRATICVYLGNLFCYFAEIFPSVYRGLGISLVTVIGRVGNVVAPVVCNYCINNGILPYYTFVLFAIVAIISTYFSMETFGKGLMEDFEDDVEDK